MHFSGDIISQPGPDKTSFFREQHMRAPGNTSWCVEADLHTGSMISAFKSMMTCVLIAKGT